MRNKLYKHHKSKASLVLRNFAVVFSSLVAFVALAAIPTYISSSNVSETRAIESQQNNAQNETQNTEDNELLNINQD